MNRQTIFLVGFAAVLGFTALWHGPLGAGERLAHRSETIARRTLDYYELPMIQARITFASTNDSAPSRSSARSEET